MKEFRSAKDVTCKIRSEENEAGQRKTLTDFLPAFFDENLIISNSEIIVRAYPDKSKIEFYPFEDNTFILAKPKDPADESSWNRRYIPGVAVSTKIGEITYIVYQDNSPINPNPRTTPTRDIAVKHGHLD